MLRRETTRELPIIERVLRVLNYRALFRRARAPRGEIPFIGAFARILLRIAARAFAF